MTLYLYICFCHIIGPLVEDKTLAGFIFALPRKLVRGLVNRAALFVWWTGAWVNEGDDFLTVYLGNLGLFYRSSHSSHEYFIWNWGSKSSDFFRISSGVNDAVYFSMIS